MGEGGTDGAGFAKEAKYAKSRMSDTIPVRVPAVPGGDLIRTGGDSERLLPASIIFYLDVRQYRISSAGR